jgi:dynein heavy chain
LARLAAHLAGYKVFTVEVRKNFRESDFREKLKDLYYMTGVEDKPTMFLFSDTQIKNESFLEDICYILSRGEIPNLYTTEELANIREAMRQQQDSFSKDVSYYEKFIERAWNNIHVVLCMSPVGDSFRNRCRMFPALVNCTTIDWFSEWPEDALKEVALKYLEDLDVGTSGNHPFTRVDMSDVSPCHRDEPETADSGFLCDRSFVCNRGFTQDELRVETRIHRHPYQLSAGNHMICCTH